jgi:hypothetical protein
MGEGRSSISRIVWDGTACDIGPCAGFDPKSTRPQSSAGDSSTTMFAFETGLDCTNQSSSATLFTGIFVERGFANVSNPSHAETSFFTGIGRCLFDCSRLAFSAKAARSAIVRLVLFCEPRPRDSVNKPLKASPDGLDTETFEVAP